MPGASSHEAVTSKGQLLALGSHLTALSPYMAFKHQEHQQQRPAASMQQTPAASLTTEQAAT
jgi:hypothetical protein